jgi:hypothetical protein
VIKQLVVAYHESCLVPCMLQEIKAILTLSRAIL